jgi:hypothetical protein
MSSDRATHLAAIAVVIVNWRNAPDTLQALASLVAASPQPHRVVVIDNGSADGSVDRFGKWARAEHIDFELIDEDAGFTRGCDENEPTSPASWLTVVRLSSNRGFAGGNNVGLALVETDSSVTHFLLLNNDAIVAPNYFAEMQRALELRPDAGLCIGTIYELPNRDRVWYAGGRMHPLRALALHSVRRPASPDPVATEFVTGCAMVISREALQRVGMLAECYFPGYMEDAEYSWRVRSSGLDLIYAPGAVVYHNIGATFGARATSPLAAYHQNRHRLFFVRRNLRGARRTAAILYMAATKPGRALVDVLRGRPDVGWATLRGTFAGLFSRPLQTETQLEQSRTTVALAGQRARSRMS